MSWLEAYNPTLSYHLNGRLELSVPPCGQIRLTLCYSNRRICPTLPVPRKFQDFRMPLCATPTKLCATPTEAGSVESTGTLTVLAVCD